MLKFAEFLQEKTNAGLSGAENLVDLVSRGIGAEQAAELRSRLQAIAEDWNHPQMAAYDEL